MNSFISLALIIFFKSQLQNALLLPFEFKSFFLGITWGLRTFLHDPILKILIPLKTSSLFVTRLS